MAGDRRGSRTGSIAVLQEFRLHGPPKLGEAARFVGGADIDLFEEDAYLAGLIDKAIAGGRIDLTPILLDGTIDERLDEALRRQPKDSRLRAMRDYRIAMREAANALAEATGVPTQKL